MDPLANLMPERLAALARVRPANRLKPEAVPWVSFNDGPFVENPPEGAPVHVRFLLGGQCRYEVTIGPGEWAKADIKYAADWRIEITDPGGRPVLEHAFDPAGRRVRVNVDSRSLGDTLAWLSQIAQYQREHADTEVYVSQFWDELGFAAQYPELRFIDPADELEECYAVYNLGCYFDRVAEQHPVDPRIVPLGRIASDILGIEYRERRPRLDNPGTPRRVAERYVCIATSATAECKHWLFADGWQTVIDRLNDMGYSVVLIQKEQASFANVIDRTGDLPIADRIAELYHCEFFVGLGSGLSWLAWALGKPVALISGFSAPWAEFVDKCYRVMNTDVCTGCWNDPEHTFDRGNWHWCPRHEGTSRQFECSRSITPEMVMDRITDLLGDHRSMDYQKTFIEDLRT